MFEVDDPVWSLLRGRPDKACDRPHVEANNVDAAAAAAYHMRCAHCKDGGRLEVCDGNYVCTQCLSVVSRQLDYGAEWRFYGAEQSYHQAANPTRCCPPSNGLIQSLGSIISMTPRRRASQWAKRSESSAEATSSTCRAGRNVQRYQVWSSMSYRDRVLCGVFDTLSSSAALHGLPTCILEEAKTLYKRVSDARITRGENRSAVIAVSVYFACKNNGVPRSLKEVAEMFSLSPRALTKATHTFQQVVVDAGTSSSSGPSDFVGRFCCRLGMDADAVVLTRRVVERADQLAIVCDAMPPSIVGGAIYFVSTELALGLSKAEVGAVCIIAPVTVVKTYKRLAAYRDALLLAPPAIQSCQEKQAA